MNTGQRTFFCAVALLTALSCTCEVSAAADSPSPEATLRVRSFRVARSQTELKKRFPSASIDNTPGINLQFLLTLKEGTMLPISRDAVKLDTFVDDTYQNLQGSGSEGTYYSGNSPSQVSDDGRSLLFSVVTARTPAEEAERLFARGWVQARVSRADPALVTNHLPLIVGQGAMVGPFRVVTRSVSDQGAGGGFTVNLTVENDPSRIQKFRLLDNAGGVLSDERQTRVNVIESAERVAQVFLYLKSIPKEMVIAECTFLENPEPVRIPFEAQVDFGIAKAGPVEAFQDGKSPKTKSTKPWPPPQDSPNKLPPRRAGFQPDTAPSASKTVGAKVGNAAVDVFSLTVAKSAPTETNSTGWKYPPPSAFYASGFTIVRLMLSTPGVSIIGVPPEAFTIDRFEDDKGGQLDTTLYRDVASTYSSSAFTLGRRSPDGQQMLLNLSLASPPTPGATRCKLAGSLQARVARGESTNTTSNIDLRKRGSFTAGPFTGRIVEVRQPPVYTPGNHDKGELDVLLSITGPIARVRTIEFLDGAENVINPLSTVPDFSSQRGEVINHSFRLSSTATGPVSLRIRYYEAEELMRIPFDVAMSVGL